MTLWIAIVFLSVTISLSSLYYFVAAFWLTLLLVSYADYKLTGDRSYHPVLAGIGAWCLTIAAVKLTVPLLMKIHS